MLRLGSMFSGYGGLDHAFSELGGCEIVWHVANDKHACAVLKERYPDVPNLGDVTTVEWNDVPQVDILMAGFPCQPVSNAGKRKGTHDDRWLWGYVEQAIRVLRPQYVFLENVSAIVNRGMSDVLGSLAEIGYDAEWGCLKASDVGAMHRRDRWFLAAWESQSVVE